MCADHNLLKKRLDDLDSLKELSQRLIKKLNELGFDENKSLSIRSRISWSVDVRQVRRRLTLLSYACLPLPASFTNILNSRPFSPECSLLLPGAGEYFFRLEIGEHPAFPQYLGIYIHVDGSQFPITLEGTSLTFLGKKFEYAYQDICALPTCSCFRVLISYKDAARVMTTDTILIECNFVAALTTPPSPRQDDCKHQTPMQHRDHGMRAIATHNPRFLALTDTSVNSQW